MKFTYLPVQGDLKSKEPQDIAAAIYGFLLWQYKTAVKESINKNSVRGACLAANKAAQEEYNREDGYGLGSRMNYDLPYSEADILRKEQEAQASEENLNAHRVCLDFFVKKFMDDSSKS